MVQTRKTEVKTQRQESQEKLAPKKFESKWKRTTKKLKKNKGSRDSSDENFYWK